MYFIQHYFISQHSDSTLFQGSGIEPSAGILEQSLGAKGTEYVVPVVVPARQAT
jgi:hypothetical protein